MKKVFILFLIISNIFAYSLKEFLTCEDVKNLTPINPTKFFYLSKNKKVYAFAYFKDIKTPFKIKIRWKKFNKKDKKWYIISQINLNIKSGIRWRTFAYITLKPYSIGLWKVELINKKNSKIIDTKYFSVDKNLTAMKI